MQSNTLTKAERDALLKAWNAAVALMGTWAMPYGSATANWWIATEHTIGKSLASPYRVAHGGAM